MPGTVLTLHIYYVLNTLSHTVTDTNIIPALPVRQLEWGTIKYIDGGPAAQRGRGRTWIREPNSHTVLLLSRAPSSHTFQNVLFSIVLHMFCSLWLIFFSALQKIRVINERKIHNTCSLARHITISLKLSTES